LQRLSLLNAVFALRLVSVLVASTVVPIAFLTGRYFFRSTGIGLLAAAFITALPELYIDIARVGNESLAIPLLSLYVYACLRTVGERRHLVWAAVILALGLLTKAYFVTVVPVFVVLAIRAFASRQKKALLLPAIVSCLALGIASLWYYHNITADKSGIWVDAAPAQPMSTMDMVKRIPDVDWTTARQ